MYILVVWGFLNGLPVIETAAFQSKENCEKAIPVVAEYIKEKAPTVEKLGIVCINTNAKYV